MALFKTEVRIQIVGLCFLLGLSIVIARLWWVQIAQGSFYAAKIRGQSEVTVRLPSVRGEIRDAKGVPLVSNRPSNDVDFYLYDMVKGYKKAFGKVPRQPYRYTVKGVLKEGDEADIVKIINDTVAPRFAELGIKEDYNAKQLQTHFRNDTLVPFTYLEDIDFADMAKLSERDLGLPGVEVTRRSVREYPLDAVASHILGYVGPADTDPEDAKNYTFYQPDVEGKNNIEQAMDKWLKGKAGIRQIKKNAKGVIEGEVGVVPPVQGNDVYLTIDARIQMITEEALRIVGRGAAVVVEPGTGNILAMASVPSFNPNKFIPSISTEDWTSLTKDETNPLTNRAILSYAPGSTFKTVTSLAGLLAGKGNNKYTCSGGVPYGNKYMKCWIAATGGSHGQLDLTDALKFSCNAYFYQFGNAAGIDMIDRVGAMLGMGKKTGLPLSNESPGVLPGKEWLAENSPKERWSDGYTANTAIGQGLVLASPLQMSLVAATLANGGTCYYPRLIDRVVDRDGRDVVDEEGNPVAPGPRVRTDLRTLGLKPDMIEKVRRGMWKVVNESGGTAGKAKLKNVEVAGKTGTAQFWRKGIKDNHTWFICFAPYQDPKYAVCVFLQGAKSGGSTAAPIAARILEESLALEQGTFTVDVKPMAPAPGSFRQIDLVDYAKQATLLAANTTEVKLPVDGEEALDRDDPADAKTRNADRDRTDSAAPKLRAAPDAQGRLAAQGGSEAEAAARNPNLMHSLRNFFRRGGGDDEAAQGQDLKTQQKKLRKQQRQASSAPAPTPEPPPKKRKFLGIF